MNCVILFFGVLSFASCLEAQQVKGNGKVILQDRKTEPFTQLVITGVFNVFLDQSSVESVKVETDENLQFVVETEFHNNTLTLQWNKKAENSHSTKMNVYVTVKDLKSLRMDGVGDLKTKSTLKLEDLSLKISGVGNTSLILNCKKIDADLAMIGNLKLEGNSNEMSMKASGTGNIKAFDFIVQNLLVDISGVGNADVRAENEISINATGVGNLSYKGNALVKKLNAEGIGKVKKM